MNTSKSSSAFRKLSIERLCTRQLMAADIAISQHLESFSAEDAPRVEMISPPREDPCTRGVKLDFGLNQGLAGQPMNNDQQIVNRKLDFDRDGYVTSLDALILVNDLNTEGAVYEKALDVNDDGIVSSLDCLAVINFINLHNSQRVVGGEGSKFINSF